MTCNVILSLLSLTIRNFELVIFLEFYVHLSLKINTSETGYFGETVCSNIFRNQNILLKE